MRTRLLITLLAATFVALAPAAAIAEDPTSAEHAAAITLFNEARALFEQGKIAEALAKFEASHELDPTAGKLLNIARCHAQLGRPASAWGAFDAAETMARKSGDADRQTYAAEQKRELEPKLSRLRILVDSNAQATEIRLDGKPLPNGAIGTAVPLDPGRHVIEADRKDAPAFRADVNVTAPGTTDVHVTQAPGKTPPPPPPYWNGQRVAAVSLGGFGVAAIVVGSIFGVKAGISLDRSQPHCMDLNPDPCDYQGVALRDLANREAWVSNIGFGVGAAALVGGVVLFATAAPKAKPTVGRRFEVLPLISPGEGAGVAALGRF